MTAEGLFDKPTQPNQPSPGTRYSPLMQLLAAVGVPLGKTRLLALARQCNLSAAGGLAYTGDRLAVEIQQALAVGEIAQVNGGMTCAAAHVHAAFREVALSGRLSAWRPALWEALHVPTNFSLWARPQSQDEPLAIMRIAACSGMTGTALRSINTYLQAYDVTWLCFKALCQPFDAAVFELVAPAEREVFAERSLMWMLHLPNTSAPALVEWVLQRDAAPPMLPALHYRLCEHLLWQGRFAEALDRIQGDGHPNAMALRAAAAVMRREAGARERYERAFDALRTGAGATPRSGGGKKAGLLPLSIAWLYAAELITSGAPAALEAARRYCRAEMREIGRDAGWVWQHLERVADTRLGDPEAQAVYAGMDGVHGLTGLITLASGGVGQTAG